MINLDLHRRYIQIAFNGDLSQVRAILPRIPNDSRIIIEAGTPFIKLEGMRGVNYIRRHWKGLVLADLKLTDGAFSETMIAARAGANAVTVLGSAPIDTLNLFCKFCSENGLYAVIDMLGVTNPLRKMMPLRFKPHAVVIHKGRDEEDNPRSIIRYKDITKIRSKFDTLISVAGGLVVDKVKEAYFNGADIAIINVVSPQDRNKGLRVDEDIEKAIQIALAEAGK
ncbi:MAG: hypothetical protein K9W46_11940 [Candidatus Heimdallarchaeum endolithica]|uniref:Orotidine 5'-phosphate decarboxylase domain-containing protein n=1 Tax=Candidatus Heimdallarchaeum endolithica TaxID=2876572 RepID=A0A9Y1BQA1_9ARCH|nr:MAG: hypothetical protein K9W46_11940 [Candidatus Heimdallarchaeum endolithica]